MFRQIITAALIAALPFAASAACLGDHEGTNDEHYAYWVDSQGNNWRALGGCVRTINDPSYHNTLEEALACGDAEKAYTTNYVTIGVNFDFDRAVLRDVDVTDVLSAIETIRRMDPASVSVSVVGHTDSIGTEAYNLGLGMQRAVAMRNFLVERGIPVTSIYSAGETQPIASNDTRAGRFENRRAEGTVEIVISYIVRK